MKSENPTNTVCAIQDDQHSKGSLHKALPDLIQRGIQQNRFRWLHHPFLIPSQGVQAILPTDHPA
jgi:hypothetical protein